jgi:hypothetical protein
MSSETDYRKQYKIHQNPRTHASAGSMTQSQAHVNNLSQWNRINKLMSNNRVLRLGLKLMSQYLIKLKDSPGDILKSTSSSPST